MTQSRLWVELNQLKEVMLIVVGMPLQLAGTVRLVEVPVVLVPELVLAAEEVVKALVDEIWVEDDVLVVEVISAVVLIVVLVDLMLEVELEDELVDDKQPRS